METHLELVRLDVATAVGVVLPPDLQVTRDEWDGVRRQAATQESQQKLSSKQKSSQDHY